MSLIGKTETCLCWHSTLIESVFFFSSRRRHTRFDCDWSSDVCSSDLAVENALFARSDWLGRLPRPSAIRINSNKRDSLTDSEGNVRLKGCRSIVREPGALPGVPFHAERC